MGDNPRLDDLLAKEIDVKKVDPNFTKWKQDHPKAVQLLTSYSGNNVNTFLTPTTKRWRIIMKSKLTKFAAVAVLMIVIGIGFMLLTSSKPAYALEQTKEALENVRFMHMINLDKSGQKIDERWIEIAPDGYQARYRQDTPGRIFVVDNRETVFTHYKDKNTVVLYDPNDESWTWHYAPGKLFDELANEQLTVIIEEYVNYKGRPAHLVRSSKRNRKAYIDPESKLPIAMCGYDISYEEPPEGIFDIPTIPEGVFFVDKRPGAEPTEEPEWMREAEENEENNKIAQKHFDEARRALFEGDYIRAIEYFHNVVKIQPGRNWAWYWLGRTYYELGEHEKAIESISKFCSGGVLSCYNLTRGLAYQKIGMEEAAKKDFGIALRAMINGLRHINSPRASLFNLADDPLIHADGFIKGGHDKPSKEQSLTMMIERLREVTDENFGYDPQGTAEEKEKAISAWEQWWQEHAYEYGVNE